MVPGAVMILDQDKNVIRINTPAEDCTGIRESGSEGMSLLDAGKGTRFSSYSN